MKYRKRPVVVEATQWFKPGDHPAVCTDPAGGPVGDRTYGVITPNGFVRIEPGEWIITGTKGEVYPCKADIFSDIYEPVVEDSGPTNTEGS